MNRLEGSICRGRILLSGWRVGRIRPQEQAKPLATPQEPGLEGKAGPDASRRPPARLAMGQRLHLTKTVKQAHLDGEPPGAMQEGEPGPHKVAQQGRGSPQGHTSRAHLRGCRSLTVLPTTHLPPPQGGRSCGRHPGRPCMVAQGVRGRSKARPAAPRAWGPGPSTRCS